MDFVRSAILATAVLGIAVSSSIGANAQTPPPKQEAELVAAGYKRLSGQEMSTLLVGNTAYMLWLVTSGTINKGTLVTMYWRDARTRVGVGNDKKKVESIWWIEGDLMCGEQKNSERKGNFCNSIYGLDSAYYLCTNPAGYCAVLMRLASGNPDKL